METQIVPAASNIEWAARLLRDGELVAFPTESVYGLGANALSQAAIEKIFIAKGRPSDNPLIVHISSMDMLHSLGIDIPLIYLPIIKAFWPGPLTILLARPDKIPLAVTAGHEFVAVRFPNHPIALALIEAAGVPIAAPSANTSGRPSPTIAEHVFSDLNNRIPLIIDGGACTVGVESTVLDAIQSPPVILRPGGITAEMISQIPGFEGITINQNQNIDKPTTPGMKYRHYTPDANVILFEMLVGQEDIMHTAVCQEIGILSHSTSMTRIGVLQSTGKESYDIRYPGIHQINLGSSLQEIGRELFKGLRQLELQHVDYILVEGVLERDEGAAIMNRLRKAASRIVIIE